MTETVVARLRPHSRALFFPILLLVVVAGAFGFLSGLREEWQVIAVCVVAAVLIVAGFLAPLTRWLTTSYTITTRRIAIRSGVLVRSRQELLLSRAHDITVTRSALQSMFGSGDVRLGTAIDQPIVLRDVPSAGLVRETLHDLMERNRMDSSIG
ncbi:hypothetical protein BH10ACT7_BH10ACT7_11050 [soil metagenome]